MRSRLVAVALAGVTAITTGTTGIGGIGGGSRPAAARPGQSSGLLVLVAQTAAVAPDEPFQLQLRVTGAPPESELEVSVHDRVLTRSQFLASIDGERLRTRLNSSTRLLAETPRDPSGTITINLDTRTGSGDPDAVRLANPGAYPVDVELHDGEGATLAEFVTHIVRLPVADPESIPLRVAMTLPVHAPPALQPDGSIAVDGLSRAGIVTVASALQRSPTLPLTVVPTPETVASLGADPASPDAALLEAVRRGSEGRQVVAGPYVDIEPAAWLTAGALTTLARQVDFGTAALANRFAEVDAGVSLADPSIDPATAAWLRDRGVSRFVVPEAAMEPLDTGEFPATLTQRFLIDGVDGIEAAMADGSLAGHVGETGDPVLDGNHLLADLAVLYLDEPPATRGVVVSLPDDRPLDPAFLATVIDGIGGIPILQPVQLGTMFDEVPLAGSEGETDGSGEPLRRVLSPVAAVDLGTLPDRLAAAEADLNSFEATVGAPNEMGDGLNRRLLVAAGRELTPTEQSTYLRTTDDEISLELSQIDLPQRQTFTLTAREGLVPIAVRNTAGYPMTVLLHLSGERLDFPDNPDGQLRLELTQEITRVEITVRTLTSGDAPLTLSVSTPDNRRELDRSRFTVRSTAVTGVGVALIGGSLLFLAAWWGRNIHRSRRNRRLMPSS